MKRPPLPPFDVPEDKAQALKALDAMLADLAAIRQAVAETDGMWLADSTEGVFLRLLASDLGRAVRMAGIGFRALPVLHGARDGSTDPMLEAPDA